jgi:hypothetical protein
MLSALAPAFSFHILFGTLFMQTRVVVGEYIIIGQPGPHYPSVYHPVFLQIDIDSFSILTGFLIETLPSQKEITGSYTQRIVAVPPVVISCETLRRCIGRRVYEPRETNQHRVPLLSSIHQEFRSLVLE